LLQSTIIFPNAGIRTATAFLRALGPAPWLVVAGGKQHTIKAGDLDKLAGIIKQHDSQRQPVYAIPPSQGSNYCHLVIKAPLGTRSSDFRVAPSIVISAHELTLLWALNEPLHIEQAGRLADRFARKVGGRQAMGESVPLPGTILWRSSGVGLMTKRPVQMLPPLPTAYRLVGGELQAPAYDAGGREDDGFILADAYTPQHIEWTWPGVIPAGHFTLLAGEPGVGKSQIAIDVASRVSRGGEWPTGEAGIGKGSGVIIMECEDPVNVTHARLSACGADLRKVAVTNISRDLSDAKGLALLDKQAAKLKNVSALVLSPVRMFFGEVEAHGQIDMRRRLDPLMEWASTHGIAVLGVAHKEAGKRGRSAEEIAGPKAIAQRARVALSAVIDENDPEFERNPKVAKRILAMAKSNLGNDQLELNYRIVGAQAGSVETSRVKWENA
jgi:hypothetical protein